VYVDLVVAENGPSFFPHLYSTGRPSRGASLPHLVVGIILCYSLFLYVYCAFVVLDLVVLDLVIQYYAKRLARKNICKMIYFVSSGAQNLNSIN